MLNGCGGRSARKQTLGSGKNQGLDQEVGEGVESLPLVTSLHRVSQHSFITPELMSSSQFDSYETHPSLSPGSELTGEQDVTGNSEISVEPESCTKRGKTEGADELCER